MESWGVKDIERTPSKMNGLMNCLLTLRWPTQLGLANRLTAEKLEKPTLRGLI
jgi:hypothetical protein